MNANDKAQLAMDQLFGVREPQIIVERPGHGDAKSGRKDVYTQALAAAQVAFPGDGVAAHRAAVRMADRASRMMHPGSTPTEEHQ
jgi:hypothetical protein